MDLPPDAAAALARIAGALDRIAPPAPAPCDLSGHPAYLWMRGRARPAPAIEAPPLDLLVGIDAQRRLLLDNVRRHAAGHAALDMLLWGARGMGKSSLVRAAVLAIRDEGFDLALVQADAADVESLLLLLDSLRGVERRFLLFIDDWSPETAAGDVHGLRSLLDGGVMARPANVCVAVTGNRRHLVDRGATITAVMADRHVRDREEDELALADRFGLVLGFHGASQPDYLAMVEGYARHYGLPFDPADALQWAIARGSRSGRVAWHYTRQLAGGLGRGLAEGNTTLG